MSTKRKKPLGIIEHAVITDAGSEGKAVARAGDLVIFVSYGAPGDVVDIQLIRKKKSFAEGKIVRFHEKSNMREEPFCMHFGLCGGCKWQHLRYSDQLFFKQKQVEDHFIRIGKLEIESFSPILASPLTDRYRNKLEFTFSNRRWLTEFERNEEHLVADMRALGFHLPGMFDRVLDILECRLQTEPSNAIRLSVKEFAQGNDLEFYDVKRRTGLLRNLILRNNLKEEWMVIVVFSSNDQPVIHSLLNHLAGKFPQIVSLMYVINNKHNDTISDLDIHLFRGSPYLVETFPQYGTDKDLFFKISPVSFFQTNTRQAMELYRIAASFTDPTENDLVYDLYTGTGTIANYIAGVSGRVIGIDSVRQAIEDAIDNSKYNHITNTEFFPGDIAEVMTGEFMAAKGMPGIVITDPPRSGMHEKVIRQLLAAQPSRIVYISCNPATQARDISLLKDHYRIEKVQPVDMFPHTQHVENVALLVKKES
ncbi:MAG TPA: 23S rRNA (uracil(1939)-C(5))-methyltransferase RlmD [Bacteroidales bacterium]|nr:23S rRNA (uracil(1939)-C(5))-methyltransferase RlmD [Bacteroidales bacterium]HRZ21408.1 23S rRNA (uracil(1939)-C(5))-methyltransferase RlmD [Bacteroidales bacterium]